MLINPDGTRCAMMSFAESVQKPNTSWLGFEWAALYGSKINPTSVVSTVIVLFTIRISFDQLSSFVVTRTNLFSDRM